MMSVGDPTTTRRNGTVRALTEKQVRRSLVNCSRSEAEGMTLPRTFAETPWEELVVLGWRDPRAPLRGYLVVEREGRPVGVAVRAADTRMSSGTPAMCLLCQTAQAGSDVSLFPARAPRPAAAPPGGEPPPGLRGRDPEEVAAERTAELEQRVHGFLDAVLR